MNKNEIITALNDYTAIFPSLGIKPFISKFLRDYHFKYAEITGGEGLAYEAMAKGGSVALTDSAGKSVSLSYKLDGARYVFW